MENRIIAGSMIFIALFFGVLAAPTCNSRRSAKNAVSTAGVTGRRERPAGIAAAVAAAQPPAGAFQVQPVNAPSQRIESERGRGQESLYARRAEVSLSVRDSRVISKKLVDIASKYSGIITETELTQYEGVSGSGSVILRVVPQNFEAALVDVKDLGEVEQVSINADDITEEYADLLSRLDNLRLTEERLTEIAAAGRDGLWSAVYVEQELTLLRENITRIETRLAHLDSLINMPAVTVNYSEP